ncbi:hypothetical protein [Streptomyces griseoaurantiacus]|uniref:hypothetical protein n=1 Tax=Streptomyces griseoaurantiacus TaxID=68213 RepID=UPI00345F85A0
MLIFLFPTARQLAAIRRRCGTTPYTVLTHPDVPSGPAEGEDLRDVTSTDVRALLHDPDARLLCLHELAVYYLHREMPPGETGFHPSCLTAVTKRAMADLLVAGGLTVTPKEPFSLRAAGGLDPEFPFVAKPDFGFASQLVCRIDDAEAWARYLRTAADPAAWPLRARYGEAFYGSVPDLLDGFVMEPDLSALDFLSVPYLFDGRTATALPVSGLNSQATANTTFAWRGFRTPTGLGEEALTELDGLLTKLSTHLELRRGIYEVEALWGPADGFRFLEFSPRPTGGLVPDLVQHAYGVDIDDLAVAAFLGEPVSVNRPRPGTFLGLRREAEDEAPRGRVAVSTVRRSATRVFVDEIIEVTP